MKKFIEKGCTYVNGILLPPAAISRIDNIQTGGSLGWDDWEKRQFSNEVLNNDLSRLAEVERHFQQLMIEDDREIQASIKMLRNLSDIRCFMEAFRLPE